MPTTDEMTRYKATQAERWLKAVKGAKQRSERLASEYQREASGGIKCAAVTVGRTKGVHSDPTAAHAIACEQKRQKAIDALAVFLDMQAEITAAAHDADELASAGHRFNFSTCETYVLCALSAAKMPPDVSRTKARALALLYEVMPCEWRDAVPRAV